MSMKLIPYGISNYNTIIREGYAYVDKTMYIRSLEQYGHYHLFLRPQRFGKSLFTSMLGYYYDIAEKENFDLLFSSTDIGKNPTKNKNIYHILQLDFSGIEMDSYETMQESFTKKMHSMLLQFCARYNLDIILEMDSPGAQLSHLFTQFQAWQTGQGNSGAKIYVIIDEYDNFFSNWLRNPLFAGRYDNSKRLDNTASEDRFLRAWYEVLKEGTKTLVDRIFITGVFPLTMESRFDILQNLSMDSEFNEMMGFTRAEVEQLIGETIPEELSFDLMDALTDYYSGYCFNADRNLPAKKQEERVFHSSLVFSYLQHYKRKQELPHGLLDQHAFNYFKELEDVITSGNLEEKEKILMEVLFDEKSTTAGLNATFFISQKFEEGIFISLLFYLGLLTIKEREHGGFRLRIPNSAMCSLFPFYSMKIMTGHSYLSLKEGM